MLGEATQNNTAKPLYNTYRYAITVKGDFFLSLAGIYLCIAAGLVLDIILIIDEELVLHSIMTSLNVVLIPSLSNKIPKFKKKSTCRVGNCRTLFFGL